MAVGDEEGCGGGAQTGGGTNAKESTIEDRSLHKSLCLQAAQGPRYRWSNSGAADNRLSDAPLDRGSWTTYSLAAESANSIYSSITRICILRQIWILYRWRRIAHRLKQLHPLRRCSTRPTCWTLIPGR